MRPLSQSEWMIAALLAGFLIYLAAKGKLAAYWSLMAGGGAPADKGAGSGPPGLLGPLNPLGGVGLIGPLLGNLGKYVGSVFGGSGTSGGAAAPTTDAGGGTVGGTTTSDGQTQSTSYPTTGSGSPITGVTI